MWSSHTNHESCFRGHLHISLLKVWWAQFRDDDVVAFRLEISFLTWRTWVKFFFQTSRYIVFRWEVTQKYHFQNLYTPTVTEKIRKVAPTWLQPHHIEIQIGTRYLKLIEIVILPSQVSTRSFLDFPPTCVWETWVTACTTCAYEMSLCRTMQSSSAKWVLPSSINPSVPTPS